MTKDFEADYAKGLSVFFVCKKENNIPKNQFQRMVFAFLIVLVTVHAYVFYSLYVINSTTLMQVTGADSVIGKRLKSTEVIDSAIEPMYNIVGYKKRSNPQYPGKNIHGE